MEAPGANQRVIVSWARAVVQRFPNIIHGNANVIGIANNSNVVLNVSKGDFCSLRQTLIDNGVSTEDINELQAALKKETEVSGKGFGANVSAWFGKMMSKAATGTWDVAVNVAGDLLTKAISKYYGLPC